MDTHPAQLLRFALVVWGLTYLLTESGAGRPVRVAGVYASALLGAAVEFVSRREAWGDRVARALATLFYCPSCAGFWLGLGLALLGAWPYAALVWAPGEAAAAAAGMMAIVARWAPQTAWQELENYGETQATEEG